MGLSMKPFSVSTPIERPAPTCSTRQGPQDPDVISQLVKEVDGPLNVVVGRKDTPLDVQRLTEVGVKRISIGGALFLACYGYMRQAAEELLGPGTFNWTSTVLDRRYLKEAIDGAADT
jgi:2-methylisocitrate lyase-like PEP mutase family enzyme